MSEIEQTFNEQEKERKERKARKHIAELKNEIAFEKKTRKNKIKQIAQDFDEANTIIPKNLICMEIMKALRDEINNHDISDTTIYYALDGKYKQDAYKHPHFGPVVDPKDLPTMEVELIEKVAGLDFQDIRQMNMSLFIQKYREIYLHTLQTMSDDEIHYQALILDYLYPMTRDMLETTEKHRAEMKKKSDMLSK